jgi:AraC-like DNA-binding protein
MHLDVRLVEVFRHEQRGALTHAEAAVSLTVSGLRHHRLPGYERWNPGPFLIIAPPGTHVEFDFGPDRENWVALLVSDDIRPGSRDGLVAIRAGAAEPWTELPCILEVSQQELPALQQAFLEVREAFRSPLASDRLRVHLGIVALIGRCLGGAPAPASRDPAARLKRLIDEDPLGRRSLAALSRGCGMSVDHLRLRFQRTYGLSPLAYRQRLRLAEAHRLLSTTDLRVGEIARRLGFRHASHFCAVFRACFGQTPAMSRRRFGGIQSGTTC